MHIRIRGGSGLGDSIYVRAIAEHLVRSGNTITACSDYPDIFFGAQACKVEPFRRLHVDRLAHYTTRKKIKQTNQWQDICISAGADGAELRIDWQRTDSAFVEELKVMARGKPIILVHGGRTPMGRTDGFGKELLPDRNAFEVVLSGFSDCFKVRIGKGGSVYPLSTDLDLTDRTSIRQMLDIAQACDGVVGQCSYAVPLAEAFAKPMLAVWAAKGLYNAGQEYIRQITPSKILSRETSMFVVDNWNTGEIEDEVRAFRFLQ